MGNFSGPSLAVWSAGAPFDDRVAAILGTLFERCEQFRGAPITDAFDGAADVVVAVLSRLSPALSEQADDLSFQTDIPWITIAMDGPVAYVGPVVTPPDGPCHTCFMRRRAQHDRHQSAVEVLEQVDLHEYPGPGGYLPNHARLVAGLGAKQISDALDLGDGSASASSKGSVITVSLISAYFAASPVIACSDCVRCSRPQTGIALTRLHAVLDGKEDGR